MCLTAGIVLIRAKRPEEDREVKKEVSAVPPGESLPGAIALDRLRELGI